MFTRPLNVKWYGIHRFWIVLTSVLDYILFAWVDHNFSCDGLLYIFLCHFHSLVFKWLNLNHSPSLCDCHSPSLPVTVKRVSLLFTTGSFPTGLGYPDSKIPRAPWMHVWPLMGHMWAATNRAHWSMQQFSTWYPWVLPVKGPTWDPHETHVCLPSVWPILGQYVITIMGPHVGCH